MIHWVTVSLMYCIFCFLSFLHETADAANVYAALSKVYPCDILHNAQRTLNYANKDHKADPQSTGITTLIWKIRNEKSVLVVAAFVN